jgi:hypothetical protein
VDRSLLARGDGTTLGDVARRLERALASVGYGERSYYTVPGGFALATRLEQITPDGTPKTDPQRWSTALPEQPVFSLGDYLHALFAAPQGDYRVIVFIVTRQAFATSARAATNEQAEAWLSGGLDRLPRTVQALPFDADVEASALVYQFRKRGHGDPPVALESSAASAATQLDRSGIVAALRR